MVLSEKLYYLSKTDLAKLLKKLSQGNQLYLSVGEQLDYHLEADEDTADSSWQFPAVRAVEPLKG